MKSARIFLVEGERKLTQMTETAYVKEDDLQIMLANYPDLLPGDQINPDDPRRFLLVAREFGVPGNEDVTGRWSLDHLFLDQDGIPTFVECKRSSDTRSRREVVAQMLDYAANGISYWKIDDLRIAALGTAQRSSKTLEGEIQKLVGSEDPIRIDEFWEHVEQNLKSGKVRLLFVADIIPTELRRLVEFLNEQMVDAEVLAVEVKQFIGDNQQKVITPRLIGMTETAREVKRKTTTWDEFNSKCIPETSRFFKNVLDTAKEHGHTVCWGTSGFSIRINVEDTVASIAYGYSPNIFQIYFGHLPWSDDQISVLRKEIIGFKIFKEAPKTLSVNLREDTIQKAEEAYKLMMQKVEAAAKK